MPEFDPKEVERLSEIAALRLGEDISEAELDAIVARAAKELELPLAAVSIILDQAQYFVASYGFEGGWVGEVRGTPIEWSFCRNAVERRAPFIVEDAENHPQTRDNPLVRNDQIRAYLGVPLITSNDQAIGALCVIGDQNRQFSMADVGRLVDLADQLLPLLEARRERAVSEQRSS